MQRAHFMKRIYVNVTEEQHDALKALGKPYGSTVSETIRRAIVFLAEASSLPTKPRGQEEFNAAVASLTAIAGALEFVSPAAEQKAND
jgi:hypothetical protein